MGDNTFILKGICIYSKDRFTIETKDGYVISLEGICQGVFDEVPSEYLDLPIQDYSEKMIIPGLVDLHLHAPQYPFCATGMDMELLDWLNTNTFPEESKYSNLAYAKEAYALFVSELRRSATTRACIFGTIHTEATKLLMDLLEETRLKTMVGKVNMDRNCPEYVKEISAKQARDDTREWIEATIDYYQHVVPILTPRFIPSCSDELMTYIGELKEEYKIALQSHLSENKSEITWVQELCPESDSYTQQYEKSGSFQENGKTIMAHCVYLTEEEENIIKKRKVYIAHCAESNINLASGIAPIRKYWNKGLKIGLGTDIAGGSSLNMLRAIVITIQSSKLYWRLVDHTSQPLSVEEVFYMATKGGGEFFGAVGSFEKGYEMDAIVLSEESIKVKKELTHKERLERLIYFGDSSHIIAKYVAGNPISLER